MALLRCADKCAGIAFIARQTGLDALGIMRFFPQIIFGQCGARRMPALHPGAVGNHPGEQQPTDHSQAHSETHADTSTKL